MCLATLLFQFCRRTFSMCVLSSQMLNNIKLSSLESDKYRVYGQNSFTNGLIPKTKALYGCCLQLWPPCFCELLHTTQWLEEDIGTRCCSEATRDGSNGLITQTTYCPLMQRRSTVCSNTKQGQGPILSPSRAQECRCCVRARVCTCLRLCACDCVKSESPDLHCLLDRLN